MRVSFEPRTDPRRVLAWSAACAVALGLVVLLPQALSVVLAGVAGVVLGAALTAASEAISKRTPLGRKAALALVIALSIGVLASYVVWVFEVTVPELQRLGGRLPEAIAELQDQLRGWGLGRVADAIGSPAGALQQSDTLRERLLGVFSSTLGGLAALALIVFVGVYTAIRPDTYMEGVVALFPPRRRPRIREMMCTLASTLRWWLVGRTLSAAVVGVATGLAVWALGVPIPLTLGVVAGVLTYVPNLGPVLTLVPAALLALTVSPSTALVVVAIYAGVQLVESYVLTPMVQEVAVEVPPALLLFAQALSAVFFGILGVALAAPLVAVALDLVKELYVEDRLEADAAPAE